MIWKGPPKSPTQLMNIPGDPGSSSPTGELWGGGALQGWGWATCLRTRLDTEIPGPVPAACQLRPPMAHGPSVLFRKNHWEVAKPCPELAAYLSSIAHPIPSITHPEPFPPPSLHTHGPSGTPPPSSLACLAKCCKSPRLPTVPSSRKPSLILQLLMPHLGSQCPRAPLGPTSVHSPDVPPSLPIYPQMSLTPKW